MITNNQIIKTEKKLEKPRERKSLRDFAGIFSSDLDFSQVLADIEARRQELDLGMDRG
jgi:hypothetical protein